jgi:hypothetical protein
VACTPSRIRDRFCNSTGSHAKRKEKRPTQRYSATTGTIAAQPSPGHPVELSGRKRPRESLPGGSSESHFSTLRRRFVQEEKRRLALQGIGGDRDRSGRKDRTGHAHLRFKRNLFPGPTEGIHFAVNSRCVLTVLWDNQPFGFQSGAHSISRQRSQRPAPRERYKTQTKASELDGVAPRDIGAKCNGGNATAQGAGRNLKLKTYCRRQSRCTRLPLRCQPRPGTTKQDQLDALQQRQGP